VKALALGADGYVYAAGPHGFPMSSIVRASTSGVGSVDQSWYAEANGSVDVLATAGAGSILAGGAFTSIAGSSRFAIAALPPADNIFYNGFE
jgi:hypothetical protein